MKKRTRETISPEITPLIDVVFLLLIFFMVSTVFKKDELALLLNLPKTTIDETQNRSLKDLLIELSPTEVAYNGRKTTLEKLNSSLLGVNKKDTPIELRIDQEVKYNRVVSVLEILKKNSLNNLTLITKK